MKKISFPSPALSFSTLCENLLKVYLTRIIGNADANIEYLELGCYTLEAVVKLLMHTRKYIKCSKPVTRIEQIQLLQNKVLCWKAAFDPVWTSRCRRKRHINVFSCWRPSFKSFFNEFLKVHIIFALESDI